MPQGPTSQVGTNLGPVPPRERESCSSLLSPALLPEREREIERERNDEPRSLQRGMHARACPSHSVYQFVMFGRLVRTLTDLQPRAESSRARSRPFD